MKICCRAGLYREEKIKDGFLYSPIIDGCKGLIDNYCLGSLGEINLTQIKGRNFHFVLIGNRSSDGVQCPRDQFFKTSKLQAGDRSRLNKCQKHFQDIMMELTHVNKVINDGQKCGIKIDSLPCLAEQKPVISNTPPDFLTETTSLGDQAQSTRFFIIFFLVSKKCQHINSGSISRDAIIIDD
jgi:hypothetical protein